MQVVRDVVAASGKKVRVEAGGRGALSVRAAERACNARVSGRSWHPLQATFSVTRRYVITRHWAPRRHATRSLTRCRVDWGPAGGIAGPVLRGVLCIALFKKYKNEWTTV